ncbi:hypothetical protein P692DRAFT_20879224 [Suillus brevipes Sb2]|nr:hypothetical protein P692DRAFT_20879224 [Suillus brevipes Sb2]
MWLGALYLPRRINTSSWPSLSVQLLACHSRLKSTRYNFVQIAIPCPSFILVEQATEAAKVATAAEKECTKEKNKKKAKDTDDPMDGAGTGGGDGDGEGEAEDDAQPTPARKSHAKQSLAVVQTKTPRMSVKSKTVSHDRAYDAKSRCMHSNRKATCKAKAAARAPSTSGTAGTSKSTGKATASIKLSDEEEDAGNITWPQKICKEMTAVTEEEEGNEEEEEGPSSKDDEELQFLMRAELECMEVRFIQVEGMVKEMATGMKFVCSCMDRVEKRKRRD